VKSAIVRITRTGTRTATAISTPLGWSPDEFNIDEVEIEGAGLVSDDIAAVEDCVLEIIGDELSTHDTELCLCLFIYEIKCMRSTGWCVEIQFRCH